MVCFKRQSIWGEKEKEKQKKPFDVEKF